MTRFARRLTAGHPEGGVTLVELLVTMVILGIIGPLIVALLVSLQRQTQTTANTAAAAAKNAVAVQTLAYQMRSGAYSSTTGAGATVTNSDATTAPATSYLGFWTGFSTSGGVLASASGRCVQFAINTSQSAVNSLPANTLSTRTFSTGSTPPTWTVVSRGIVSGSYFGTPFATSTSVSNPVGLAPGGGSAATVSASNPAAQVPVHLRDQVATGTTKGRTSSVDTVIALRNTTTASTTACAVFN